MWINWFLSQQHPKWHSSQNEGVEMWPSPVTREDILNQEGGGREGGRERSLVWLIKVLLTYSMSSTCQRLTPFPSLPFPPLLPFPSLPFPSLYLARVISIGSSPVGSTSFANTSLLISITLTCSSTPASWPFILARSASVHSSIVWVMLAWCWPHWITARQTSSSDSDSWGREGWRDLFWRASYLGCSCDHTLLCNTRWGHARLQP